MGKKGDVDLVGYLTEVKSGRQVPKTVVAWLETIRDLATDGEIPILVMQPKFLKERIVALTLTDFIRVRDGGRENGRTDAGIRPIETETDGNPSKPTSAANPAAVLMRDLRKTVEHDCLTREHDPDDWCPDCFVPKKKAPP